MGWRGQSAAWLELANGRGIPVSGTANGSDQLAGIPVSSSGASDAADPAKSSAINAAGRVARRLVSGNGIIGDVTDEAIGAGRETARRATTTAGYAQAQLAPAPKGTRFFVFVNSIGSTAFP